MKKIRIFCAALVLLSFALTGCTGGGNVSDNEDGMIESSTQTTPTETTLRPTMEPEIPGDGGLETTRDTIPTESHEGTENTQDTENTGRSVRGNRIF